MAICGPIGVFDSGVGGLAVLREVRRELPDHAVIYVADSGFAPYGGHSASFIEERSDAICRFLLTQGATALVVACNTATSVAVERLRAAYTVPVVAIEPAVKPAAAITRSGVIAVMATTVTLESARFSSLVTRHGGAGRVITQPCPGLADRVEAGDLDGPDTRALVERFVRPLVEQGADVLVLGCTHYTFLAPLIQDVAGAGVAVVDPAPAVAREVRRRLEGREVPGVQPSVREAFWASGRLDQVARVIRQLWHPDAVVRGLPAEYAPTPRGD